MSNEVLRLLLPSLLPRGETLRIGLALLTLILAGSAGVPAASAQQEPPTAALYDFELEVTTTFVELDAFERVVRVPFFFHDHSRDGLGGVDPGAASASLLHNIRFMVEPEERKSGWAVNVNPTGLSTRAGETVEGVIFISVSPAARDPYYTFTVTSLAEAPDGSLHQANATITAYGLPVVNFDVGQPPAPRISPGGIADLRLEVENNALTPREFRVDVVSVGCGMAVAAPGNIVIPSKTRDTYWVAVEAPDDKPLYLSQLCPVELSVYPADRPDQARRVFVSVQVDGFYIDPSWVFTALALTGVLVLVFLFVRRHKAKLEEEILGKPQKPWLIPVEAVYLEHLKRRDQRAWYVVRHFLMEDEHRSAMLWYKDRRKADRGRNQKERLILRQEHQYERWKRRWAKRIAKPEAEADRFEARLQRKLDRKAKARHKKTIKRYAAVVKKQEKAYEAQVQRATERWEKQRAKAEKKGLAAPPKPVVPEPEIDDPPPMQPIRLADHRWHKKAQRARRRAARKRGDLEVRFEKADARHLMKVRRKVRKLARRIDDPDFVMEHPLLHEGSGA